jgi:TPR repeat protein
VKLKLLRVFFVFIFLSPITVLAMNPSFLDEEDTSTPHKKRGKIESSQSNSSNVEKTKNKKIKTIPVRLLTKNIAKIQDLIIESHEEASAKKVFEAYSSFQALEYNETEWESLARTLEAYKWPSQSTWKESVGGHLFFPEETVDWAKEHEVKYNHHWARRNDAHGYLLTRIDNLWAFVIGAKFNHPVSTFYFGKMGEEVWSNYNCGVFINFFKKFCEKALKDLEKCTDNPDARYVLAFSGNYSDEEAYKFCLQGETTTSDRYHALLIKDYVSRYASKEPTEVFNNPPKAQNFYDFGRENKYGPSLIKTALLAPSSQKIPILMSLSRGGYDLALLRLGDCFLEEANVAMAREYYLKAAESGISRGYIKLANTYVGNRIHEAPFEYPKKKFKKISQEDFDKAVCYFNLATQAKNQEGAEHLITLYVDLHEYEKSLSKTLPEKDITKSDITRRWDDGDVATTIFLVTSETRLKPGPYNKDISAALKQGMKMGSARCYQWAVAFYEEEAFWQLLKKYGFAPQFKNFRIDVKNFLKKGALPSFVVQEKPIHQEEKKARSKKGKSTKKTAKFKSEKNK